MRTNVFGSRCWLLCEPSLPAATVPPRPHHSESVSHSTLSFSPSPSRDRCSRAAGGALRPRRAQGELLRWLCPTAAAAWMQTRRRGRPRVFFAGGGEKRHIMRHRRATLAVPARPVDLAGVRFLVFFGERLLLFFGAPASPSPAAGALAPRDRNRGPVGHPDPEQRRRRLAAESYPWPVEEFYP